MIGREFTKPAIGLQGRDVGEVREVHEGLWALLGLSGLTALSLKLTSVLAQRDVRARAGDQPGASQMPCLTCSPAFGIDFPATSAPHYRIHYPLSSNT